MTDHIYSACANDLNTVYWSLPLKHWTWHIVMLCDPFVCVHACVFGILNIMGTKWEPLPHRVQQIYKNIRDNYFTQIVLVSPEFQQASNIGKLLSLLGEKEKCFHIAAQYVCSCHQMRDNSFELNWIDFNWTELRERARKRDYNKKQKHITPMWHLLLKPLHFLF